MAVLSSRLQVAQLTKANEQLQREVSEYKSENLVLRHEIKTFVACREEESRAIQSDYEEAIKNRDVAVTALQKSMEKSRRQFEREKEVLQHKMIELEEMHKADKLHLKNELKKDSRFSPRVSCQADGRPGYYANGTGRGHCED
jgi:ornithine carbamoyltransferase